MYQIGWLLLPLVVMNSYHAFMIYAAGRQSGYRRSISESALSDKIMLRVYKTQHIVGDICFALFALILFRDYGAVVPAVFLSLAAVFDALQIVTLSEKTNHTPFYWRDIHQLAAWLMTVLYLFFAISLLYVNQSYLAIGLFILYLFFIFLASRAYKHKYFWLAQMTAFVSISVVMVIAAIQLINRGGL